MRLLVLVPLALVPAVLFSCKTNPASGSTGADSSQPLPNMPAPDDQKPADKPADKPVEKPGKRPAARDFVGMRISAAEKLADRHRIKHRTVAVDGKIRPVTMDYRPDRINFTVENGVVTRVTNG